jgi:hypothetical protein
MQWSEGIVLPLLRNKCQDIVLGFMTNLDFRDTQGHLFPNRGDNILKKVLLWVPLYKFLFHDVF